MQRVWNWLASLALALVLGELILAAGGLPPALFLFGNLKFLPSIPWLLPATALWLWAFWRYLNGAGWPRGTAELRRRSLRAGKLPFRVWRWALLAGGLGMVSVVGLSFLTAKLSGLPRSTFKPSFDLSPYPSWTIYSAVLAISVVAGVVEESAFRGVLLSIVQALHGWLVYLTRSIRPSIFLHAAADLVVLPIQLGVAGEVDPSLTTCLVLLIVPALVALPAFWQLARAADRS